MTILVTGAAGFIGFHVCQALLARGERVLGVDNLNAYYDVALKEARLALLQAHAGFAFARADIADRDAMVAVVAQERGSITRVVHLAAQAGVRHSLVDPYAYVQANVMGQVVILELCRGLPALKHLVYASSSSVYGVAEAPFRVEARVDSPVSLYAATKTAGELIGHVYGHLHAVPATGLRFFTVYGPWGRPDMAYFLFTRSILEGRPITLFNHGRMKRDFTYIDDVVPAVLGVLDAPPVAEGDGAVLHRLYNVGNDRPEALTDFVAELERALGRKAVIEHAPMQPGDVEETWADIAALQRDHGYAPKTTIAEGIPRFVAWYREHYKV